VVALTGGYRRTPFMQIGADIYCDSALMCRVIDRLEPEPPLHPDFAGGAAPILAQWADASLFWVAVPLTIRIGGPVGILPDASPEFLKAFGVDRAAMSAGVRRPGVHDARAQLLSYLGWLEQQLADGRPFMLGSLACIADFSIAQSLWFMRLSAKAGALLEPYTKLRAWYGRIAAFGHGTATERSSADALALAAAASGHAPCSVEPGLGFDAGAEVTVSALDYGTDPVAGRLVGLSGDEAVVERHDERAGTVHVHFPRIGFQIKTEQT
jgi:glutathione S-transferase